MTHNTNNSALNQLKSLPKRCPLQSHSLVGGSPQTQPRWDHQHHSQ